MGNQTSKSANSSGDPFKSRQNNIENIIKNVKQQRSFWASQKKKLKPMHKETTRCLYIVSFWNRKYESKCISSAVRDIILTYYGSSNPYFDHTKYDQFEATKLWIEKQIERTSVRLSLLNELKNELRKYKKSLTHNKEQKEFWKCAKCNNCDIMTLGLQFVSDIHIPDYVMKGGEPDREFNPILFEYINIPPYKTPPFALFDLKLQCFTPLHGKNFGHSNTICSHLTKEEVFGERIVISKCNACEENRKIHANVPDPNILMSNENVPCIKCNHKYYDHTEIVNNWPDDFNGIFNLIEQNMFGN